MEHHGACPMPSSKGYRCVLCVRRCSSARHAQAFVHPAGGTNNNKKITDTYVLEIDGNYSFFFLHIALRPCGGPGILHSGGIFTDDIWSANKKPIRHPNCFQCETPKSLQGQNLCPSSFYAGTRPCCHTLTSHMHEHTVLPLRGVIFDNY